MRKVQSVVIKRTLFSLFNKPLDDSGRNLPYNNTGSLKVISNDNGRYAFSYEESFLTSSHVSSVHTAWTRGSPRS